MASAAGGKGELQELDRLESNRDISLILSKYHAAGSPPAGLRPEKRGSVIRVGYVEI